MKLEIEISTSIYNVILKNPKDYSFEILTLKQIKSLDRAIRKGKVISELKGEQNNDTDRI